MYAFYTAIAFVGLVTVFLPVALVRRLTRGVALNARARLGRDAPRAGAPTGWVHAVSVGEAIAAAPLVEGLRRLHPDLPLVMTTVTSTGAQIVRERFAGLATHRFFPLDFPSVARRAVASINPAFLICMETELWPNTLRALAIGVAGDRRHGAEHQGRTRERRGNLELVPGRQPPRRTGGESEGHHRRAGDRRQRDDAGAELPPRPARPVGRERDIAAGAHGRHESSQRSRPAPRRRAADNLEAEATGIVRDEAAVA